MIKSERKKADLREEGIMIYMLAYNNLNKNTIDGGYCFVGHN